MLSLIEVTCPHCGAHGQVMLPPVGTIIVGPCPECQGLVVVFCGQVLALQKETMLHGSREEKCDHMLAVLTDFLRDRISQMITDDTAQAGDVPPENKGGLISDADLEMAPVEPIKHVASKAVPITEQEYSTFANVELKLLDNKDYFRSIFG